MKNSTQKIRCCGFLDFAVATGPDAVALTITAPPEAGEDARALFTHLLSGSPDVRVAIGEKR